MKTIILLKCGEMVLKGLNRRIFVEILIRNIKRRLKPFGEFTIYFAQSAVYITPGDEFDLSCAYRALKGLFGISTMTIAYPCEKDMEAIYAAATDKLSDVLKTAKTFKVEAKRSDKKFPLDSMEISKEVGRHVLSAFPNIRVDVHNPEVRVIVEIRDKAAYIHAGSEPGAGGLPLSSSGKATVLLSGGIDSPVAAYMIAKRGVSLNAVHFFSHPYTSEMAKQKVLTLAKKLCEYCFDMPVHVVPFTDIQLAIKKYCPDEYFTIIMRRLMVIAASRIAKREKSGGLITGESIGQVASQTLPALMATDHAADIPIFRPLIGMDKSEIVEIANKIDTFETSILPYEDCCTIFTPKHPSLRPELPKILEAEALLPVEELIADCIKNTEVFKISLEAEGQLTVNS